ncbi:3-hydroxy-9,10-secoandrosta-1,3,5(10)-triene-9,17-dione monooxygenase oxygenase subunit [Nocardioides pelophilus]|uniref:3-hydroxy-9,10-secoandrosta-1,3,5(10)-triene-9, 17-dione monooxygenase oxygenase subunit n=1 Tax=Nocardioides pelophilus TaxID=2172019 RepID=UPI0016028155|nr:3-hydroxy-9,10-secoandrosta-1,3,5(10)-triene-9,17-dione monooxygenase oxygenase subunit [Nocardioides pelophilus]
MTTTVLENLRDLLPGFRERAEECEQQRAVPEQSVKELEAVGVFRMLQPRRYDGLEGDPLDFYEAIRQIASADASTGWVASVLSVHAWQLALFPAAAQEAVWGPDTATLMSSSYAPTGRVTLADGGYVVSGRWSFSSGCDHADWVLLGGLVTDDDGNLVDFRTFLLPGSDYVVEDTWDTVGLAGTGSHDIVVDRAFVPVDFTLSMTETGRCAGPGQALNGGELYRLPFHSLFTSAITTPIIGMAYGAFADHVETQQHRVRAAYAGERAAEDPFQHVRIARAAADIDAAWAMLGQNVRTLQAHVSRGEPIPLDLRLKVRRDQVVGTERAIEAIDVMFESAGARALARGGYLQRAWRDAHAGRVHAANDPERALRMYGADQLGLRVEPGMY